MLARRAVAKCLKLGVRFLAISEFTRSDLANWAHVEDQTIGILPPGIGEEWWAHISEADIETARRESGITQPYLCWTGEITKRKNVHGLLRAYAQALRIAPGLPDLVLVGDPGRDSLDIDRLPTELGVAKRVHRIPRLPFDKLIAVVSGSAGFVFPSWYEGFGLPVVEALARGIPVAVSNRTSLPEVSGPDALLFDPSDCKSMSDALMKLAHDDDRRKRVQQSGPLWAKRFSHSAAASVLRNEIHQVAAA
jgi:alpha-1,3-rhamnosyl/mannosyltransferase